MALQALGLIVVHQLHLQALTVIGVKSAVANITPQLSKQMVAHGLGVVTTVGSWVISLWYAEVHLAQLQVVVPLGVRLMQALLTPQPLKKMALHGHGVLTIAVSWEMALWQLGVHLALCQAGVPLGVK
jgi:hypothetical protein